MRRECHLLWLVCFGFGLSLPLPFLLHALVNTNSRLAGEEGRFGDNDAYRNEPAFSKRRHQSFRLRAAAALAMCSGFGEMYPDGIAAREEAELLVQLDREVGRIGDRLTDHSRL